MRFASLVVLALILAIPSALAHEAIHERLQGLNIEADAIEATAIPGLYAVRVDTETVYVSADGRYLLQGSLIDLETGTNLTEAAQRGERAALFANLADQDLVVFAPEGETRHVINVFTDTNCGFCRRLHSEMSDYLAAGVKVRYLMFPVMGEDSPRILRDIWCAEDSNTAMDRAKAGLSVPEAVCLTPALAHRELAEQIGVSGTPGIVLESGQLIAGYRPAADLIRELNGTR